MIGPWVTPDNAMKKVTQSELKVRGPATFRGAAPRSRDRRRLLQRRFCPSISGRTGQDDRSADNRRSMRSFEGRRAFRMGRPGRELDHLTDRIYADREPLGPLPEGRYLCRRGRLPIDYLDPAALDDHFHHLGHWSWMKPRKPAGGWIILVGQLGMRQADLDPRFPAQFLRFRGYDLKPYLPALSGHTVVNAEVTARFKEDFDRTVEDGLAKISTAISPSSAVSAGSAWAARRPAPAICRPWTR